jgi:hypothetical protein
MRVTVVIPVRDDCAGLERALLGLAGQTQRPDEVLVINSGQTPLPVDSTTGLPLRQIRIGPAMPGAARNAGASAAVGEWLAFLDAGTEPDPGWLGAFMDAGETTPEAEILFGSYRPRVRDDWDWSAVATYVAPSNVRGDGRSPTTASLCLRRSAWGRLGGMREDLRAGEDLLFFDAIAAAGVGTALVSSAQVSWDLPQGPGGHFSRLRRYSAATWRTALSRRWQRPVIQTYAAGGLAMAACLALHPPLIWLLGVLAVSRLARRVFQRRTSLHPPFRLGRLARVPVMFVIADFATLLGVADALLGRPESPAH